MSDLVAECLSLRRWAIPLLSRSVGPEQSVASLPRVALDAWRLFLAAETCSGALAARLGAAAALLPADACAALQRASLLEVQREMAARAQLATLDVIAEQCEVEPAVLKGGVHAADGGEAFDLADIDLLLDGGDAATLGRALIDEGGYSFDARTAQYRSDGAITVELHTDLEVGYGVEIAMQTETVRLGGFRRLRRLSPGAHVVHCIQHSTTKHALRRGHLRDVLLIADALDDCSPADIAAVARALHGSRVDGVYAATLALAQSMRATSSSGAPADPFVRMAAGKYATSVWLPLGAPSLPLLLDHAPAFVASAADGWRVTKGYLTTEVQPASRWYSSRIARISPALATALGAIVRTPYRLVALGCAAVLGGVIRVVYALRWSRDDREPSSRPPQ